MKKNGQRRGSKEGKTESEEGERIVKVNKGMGQDRKGDKFKGGG